MCIGKNIKALRDKRGLTQQQLGEIAGVSDKAVSTWESGTNTPRMGAIQKIADYFGIPKSAIVDGHEQQCIKTITIIENANKAGCAKQADSNLSDMERQIGRAYGKASLPVKRTVEVALDPYMEKDTPPDNIIRINFDLSEQKASAGKGIPLDDESMVSVNVRAHALPSDYQRYPGRYFGVPVGGNSMEPRFRDGDILIVCKEPVNIGEIGIFTMEGEGYVKELGRGVLHSLNPEYDDIPLTEDIRCNGKVVGILDPDDVFVD